MDSPSRDHVGATSSASASVRARTVPSGRTRNTSASPSARAETTSVRPSGLQRGPLTRAPPKVVSCRAPVPSASATQTSWLPERVETKATREPSGATVG